MIQFLSGILSEATEENIVVECGGVGYEVSVPTTVIANLPSIGDSIKIFTHHYIREDSQSLYGFLRTQDRLLFGTLISVSGVGPKVGIRFFSAMHADQLVNAIVAEDVRLLTSVPGVGKKLAERVIIELKDKLPKLYHLELSTATKLPGKPLLRLGDDLNLALKQLGYHQEEIRNAIGRASEQLDESMSLESALKVVFKHLVS